jgi:hypothetical protein
MLACSKFMPIICITIEKTARCFLRLANLPNFRLSRYEASLWRQASRILYALQTLDRRKPQERTRRFWHVTVDHAEPE